MASETDPPLDDLGDVAYSNDPDFLRQKLDEVSDLYSRQNRMLAQLAHDMRSPLGVILAASQMAAFPNIKEEKRNRSLTLVQDSARQLQSLIQDIFDLSRLQLGSMDFSDIRFQLRDLLENIIAGQALLAQSKGVKVILWLGPDCPSWLRGDPGRLRQVVQNLLSNAVKFTPNGSVEVFVDALGQAEAGVATLQFAVQDSGVGISDEDVGKIFEPFQQAHKAVRGTYGGTGLGLAICRHIVEKMGGKIWVESQPGRGSTFKFTAKLAVAQDLAEATDIDLTGQRVVVADEDPTSRAQTEEKLLRLKMVPVLAESGTEAVAALTEAATHGSPFPFAIFDLNIGGGEGFFIIDQIPPDVRSQTSIIAITAVGQRGDGVRCQEVSIKAYLTTPVTELEFEQVIRLLSGADHNLGLITRHVLRETFPPA